MTRRRFGLNCFCTGLGMSGHAARHDWSCRKCNNSHEYEKACEQVHELNSIAQGIKKTNTAMGYIV
jgi:hypothetical protein